MPLNSWCLRKSPQHCGNEACPFCFSGNFRFRTGGIKDWISKEVHVRFLQAQAVQRPPENDGPIQFQSMPDPNRLCHVDRIRKQVALKSRHPSDEHVGLDGGYRSHFLHSWVRVSFHKHWGLLSGHTEWIASPEAITDM